MTANELLKAEIDDAGYQLTKVMEGLDETTADHRATPESMSAREMIEHLTEAYVALTTQLQGDKYEWGSYKSPYPSWPGIRATWLSERGKAIQATFSASSDEAINLARDFIVAHDYYHVGQMMTQRLSLDPKFDSYVIYQH